MWALLYEISTTGKSVLTFRISLLALCQCNIYKCMPILIPNTIYDRDKTDPNFRKWLSALNQPKSDVISHPTHYNYWLSTYPAISVNRNIKCAHIQRKLILTSFIILLPITVFKFPASYGWKHIFKYLIKGTYF